MPASPCCALPGSGKILKTELRQWFTSGSAPLLVRDPLPASAAVPQHASPAQLDLVQAAGQLARLLGGQLHVQPAAGLGISWGSDVHAQLAYILVLGVAAKIQVEAAQLLDHAGLQHLVVACLERVEPHHTQGLEAVMEKRNATVVVVQLQPAALWTSNDMLIRSSLAAARDLLPPFAAVLYSDTTPTLVTMPASPVVVTHAAPVMPSARQGPSVESVTATIKSTLLGLLGHANARDISLDEPLMAAGLISTLAVQLTIQLEAAFGRELPGTLVFDYPSIRELANFLVSQPSSAATSVGATAPRCTEQKTRLANVVIQHVCSLVGIDGAELNGTTPLMAAGLTSTLAVQLVSALEGAFGAELPGTLVFDYPSADEIAEFVLDNLISAAQQGPAPVSTNTTQQTLLESIIVEQVAALVGSGEQIGTAMPLMAAGLTSSMAVELVSALEVVLGTELPGTLVFDYPSAAEIAAFVLANDWAPTFAAANMEQTALLPVPPPAAAIGHVVDAAAPQPVCAITASAHSVPGGKLVWQEVMGSDRITCVPLERWDVEAAPTDNPRGGFSWIYITNSFSFPGFHCIDSHLTPSYALSTCLPSICRAQPAVWVILARRG